MKNRNPITKHLLLAAVSLVLAVCIGTAAMIAVYCLPTRRMNDNIGKSLDILEVERHRFTWAPGYAGTGLDGYTDAIMLGNAVYRGSGSHLRDAMLNPRVYYQADENPLDSVTKYVNKSELSEGTEVTYSRYWHGYLAWLKPMLLFFTLSDIRMLNMMFQFGLALYLLLELFRLGGYRMAIPFAVALLSINPISAALCLQYSSVYDVMLLGALGLLKLRLYDTEYDWYVFLWIGILTAFFDFLTYPVAALGINLVLITILSHGDFKGKILRIIRATFAWCLGYAGMWSGKWIIAFLLTGNNTIADALGAVANRSGADAVIEVGKANVTPLDVIRANLNVYCNSASALLLLFLVCLLIIWIFVKKPRFHFDAATALPLLLIALYPFVWYAAVKNHSIVHFWMTHRNLSVTIFALACLIAGILIPNSEEK